MMLSGADLLLIVATAVGCTGAVTLVSLGLLRWARRRSLGFQIVVIVVGAVLSIVASTVAISAEMYLSAHDLQVLLWVVGVAAVLSVAAALATAASSRRQFVALGRSVSRVGEGQVVPPGAVSGAVSGKEFAELSEQLSQSSVRLAQARAEIERLDSARRQFFAWISHDLRTPLTGISALSEALEEGSVQDPADYLRQIRAQVGTMNRLVDDLFELSQIQSGTLRLRLEDVELLDIVSDAVADVGALAAGRNVRMRQAGVEGQVLRADPHELTRVIVNLLTNSIRHAPAGSEILISADRRGERLVLSVLDQGSGVDSEDLSRMFDVGWRANSARTPAPRVQGSEGNVGAGTTGAGIAGAGSPGAGLGLAIVRGIVQAHGGQVGAENVEAGFRLNVALPTGVPEARAEAVAS